MATPPGMPTHYDNWGWDVLYRASSAIGQAAFGAGKFVGKNVVAPSLRAIGKEGYKATNAVGSAGLEVADRVGTWVFGMDKQGVKNWGSAIQEVGTSFVHRTPEQVSYNRKTNNIELRGNNLKMTKLGLGVALTAGVIGSLRGRYADEKAKKMGEMATQARSSTPDMSPVEYQTSVPKRFDNAGATGDLVFALRKLR